MKKQLLTAAASIGLALGSAMASRSSSASAPRPVEVVPAPRSNMVWVPGFHRWDGHGYAWVRGHYAHPPGPEPSGTPASGAENAAATSGTKATGAERLQRGRGPAPA